MKIIKIDNEIFEVHDKIYTLFDHLDQQKTQAEKQVDIHLNAVRVSNKMLDDCRFFLAKLIRGEKLPTNNELWILGAEMRVKYEIESKNGISRWLYDNWNKISSLKCDCGKLVSYNAVRETSILVCDDCKLSITPPAPEGDRGEGPT